MKKWSRNERRLFALCIIFLVLVGVKSIFFDGYTPQDEKENTVIELALKEIKVKPWINKKVVKIKELDPEHYEHVSMTYGYLVVVRKYFLGLVPIGESRVLK